MEIVTNIGVKYSIYPGGWSVVNGCKKYIDPSQKLAKEPYPINKSLKINPANTDPIAKITKGASITIGES